VLAIVVVINLIQLFTLFTLLGKCVLVKISNKIHNYENSIFLDLSDDGGNLCTSTDHTKSFCLFISNHHPNQKFFFIVFYFCDGYSLITLLFHLICFIILFFFFLILGWIDVHYLLLQTLHFIKRSRMKY